MKASDCKRPGMQEIERATRHPANPRARQKTSPAASKPRAGTVEIANRDMGCAGWQAAINRMFDLRADKIAVIKAALSAGVYAVDALKIAEKILEEMRTAESVKIMMDEQLSGHGSS